jgi:hypothetical protein
MKNSEKEAKARAKARLSSVKTVGELENALSRTMADIAAGRITPREGNAISIEAGKILKATERKLRGRQEQSKQM